MSQNNGNWNIPSQPCPVCGSNSEYRIWSRFVNSNYTHIVSQKHSIAGSVINPLVCTQRGFVQLFADPADFRNDQLPQ